VIFCGRVLIYGRSGWQKLWDTNTTSLNFTGFLAPTYANGSIQTYDPLSCGVCDWLAIAYEGVPWEYSWTIPFDMRTLIDRKQSWKTYTTVL